MENSAEEVKRIITVVKGEMKRSEIQIALELRHDDNFRTQYILPALEQGVIEMTYPGTPNHPNQRYRLTKKGLGIQKNLKR